MSKLTITDDQEIIVAALDTALQQALLEGVQDGGANPVLSAMQGYNDTAIQPQQAAIKLPFKSLAAALIAVINLRRALPTGISTTVALAKLTPMGVDGSLTFVDGILTAKVDPT